jgi:hypothetical protein
MKKIDLSFGFSIPIGEGEYFHFQVGGSLPTKMLLPRKGTRASKRKKRQQKLLPPSVEE